MDSDRPANRREEDRLGFSPVADHLAQVIVDQAVKDGLVFGIEGKWGSGKSTLINFTIDALRGNVATPPEIVEFSPWLVGDRDALIQHLFAEIASAASRIDPVELNRDVRTDSRLGEIWAKMRGNSLTQLRRKEKIKQNLANKLNSFGILASSLAKVVKISGDLGVPYANMAGNALQGVGTMAAGAFSSASLAKRKSEIVEALRLLSRRIVIFIDDLDRLEPREASEMLRLIRAVADFPNVIYVLSYDGDVVAKTLESALQVDNGRAYLEKIVQVGFQVPRPEAFDLRRWFQDEVRALFAIELSELADPQRPANQRLAQAIDIQGGRYLTTPRHVVRAINALRLHGVPVRTSIDIADMVWLQLVRLGNPVLYSWTEEYLTEASAVYRGAGITAHSAQQLGESLDRILETEGLDVFRARLDLAEILPGVAREFKDDKEIGRVFNDLQRETFNKFVVEKRLGSPEHYRYYFAFAQPAGALSDKEVEEFIALAESDLGKAIEIFARLVGQTRPQGGAMAEVLIERLISAVNQIPIPAVPGIFGAFATNLDDLGLSSAGEFDRQRVWGAAQHCVELLLRRVTQPKQRAECVTRLFAEGRALGWLTSLLRSEIFAHGHYGDGAEPEDRRLLTPEEFGNVLATMLRRFVESSPEVIMAVPNLLSLLYAWQQGSKTEDVKHWVQRIIETDEGFLNFLSKVRGWVVSSAQGIYFPLNKRDLVNFIDYDMALMRVRGIVENESAAREQRQVAKELLLAFEQGSSDF